MFKSLCEEFRRFQGQPVDIFTDDRRHRRGIVLYPMDEAVRIIDDCGCITLIEYCHIDAVEEPQMSLRKCRKHGHCRDNDDCDDFDEFDGREGREYKERY